MMQVRYACEPAPDATANEDHVLVCGPLLAVLDGASTPAGMDTGCIHGTPWYVTRLAAHLANAAQTAPQAPLQQVLAAAIRGVRDDHDGQCDLTNPGTPAAALGMLRDQGNTVDYLILCDVTLVLDYGDDLQVLTDARFGQAVADLRAHTRAHPPSFGTEQHAEHLRQVTKLRWQRINQPSGYWVAAADPTAADHAITGNLPLYGHARVHRAALLTDGAADAVTRYQLHTWSTLLDLLTAHGPGELIRQVRTAELADTTGHNQPRHKRHDDATAAVCLFQPEQL